MNFKILKIRIKSHSIPEVRFGDDVFCVNKDLQFLIFLPSGMSFWITSMDFETIEEIELRSKDYRNGNNGSILGLIGDKPKSINIEF